MGESRLFPLSIGLGLGAGLVFGHRQELGGFGAGDGDPVLGHCHVPLLTAGDGQSGQHVSEAKGN